MSEKEIMRESKKRSHAKSSGWCLPLRHGPKPLEESKALLLLERLKEGRVQKIALGQKGRRRGR